MVIHKRMIAALTQEFGEERLGGLIRTDIRLAESFDVRRPIFDYAPSSRGAQDYDALVERLSALWGLQRAAAPARSQALSPAAAP